MTFYEAASLVMELYVCAILTAEYVFDWKQVMKQAQKIKQRTKKQYVFDELNIGEGK